MRTSKIAALVAATALLVVGSAIAAMAATNGWVEESGTWKYYKNGEAQSECFAKSGDNWYWLDENGEMATDKLVSYNDNTYYVDENGVMVKNTWKKLENTEDDDFGEYVYYYFQNTGKAYKGGNTTTPSWKTINGKKYTFNDEGKMLYGWLTYNGDMVSDEDNNAYLTGVYYCGAADDGARTTSAWKKLYIVADDEDGDKWFYFGTNGQKYVDNKSGKSINGKKYAFDENGIMLAEWVDTTTITETASAYGYAWFQDVENGAKYANGWFKTVPTASLNSTDNNNEDQHWYYADGKGNLASSCIKSIKGKQYAFNAAGEMLTGLQWVNADNTEFISVDENIDDYVNPVKAYKAGNVPSGKKGLHYFSEDADNDGSMKTGTVTAAANGDSYTLKLGTKGTGKGVGIWGKDGNYIYINGNKLAADAEYKLGFVQWDVDDEEIYHCSEVMTTAEAIKAEAAIDPKLPSGCFDDYVALTTTGSIIKNGTKTDSDGYKVKVASYYIVNIWDTNYDSKTQTQYYVYTK